MAFMMMFRRLCQLFFLLFAFGLQAHTIRTIVCIPTVDFKNETETVVGLKNPRGVALDPAGNLYITDADNHLIHKVESASGKMVTIAGCGRPSYCGDGGPAQDSHLNSPHGITIDSQGHVYVVDKGNSVIRKIDPETSIITTVAGCGTTGFCGDECTAISAELNSPESVAVDLLGNLYIADTGNHCIRKVDHKTGQISTFAGIGMSGFSQDGEVAAAALLNSPKGLAVDKLGNLYLFDAGNRAIRKIDEVTGLIFTVAKLEPSHRENRQEEAFTEVSSGGSLAIDATGNLYISDTCHHCIYKLNQTSGQLEVFVGNQTPSISGEDGSIARSELGELNSPEGITLDAAGNLYVADTGNNVIKQVLVSASLSLSKKRLANDF